MAEDRRLSALARAARSLYVFHYRQAEERRTGVRSRYGERPIPQWDGGRDRAGRAHQPVWPRVARAALGLGADLADYVAAQFAPGAEPPKPNQLASAAAAGRYLAAREDGVRRARHALDAQHAQLMLGVAENARVFRRDDVEATRAVLMDRRAPMSALYRYCVASRLGEDGVAACFREAALTQLLAARGVYREAWAGLVPDGLIREADSVVQTLMGGEGSRAS